VRVKVGGIEEFVAEIKNIDKQMRAEALKEVTGAALRTAAIAKQKCQPLPGDDAELTADIRAVAASINTSVDATNLTSQVFAGNTEKDNFAAYLEFGTGQFAAKYVKTLPYEYEVLAWQFFVNGKGTMQEHPFLIPAYRQEGKRFIERMKGLKPLR
jgi:HK97 gp10 family phage protein